MKRLVPVWPWPMPPKLAEILEAIEGIQPVEALPGGPGPVLAVRSAPPWACDSIVVLKPEKAAQAVDIVIRDGVKLSTMGEFLGGKELPSVKVEPKVRFK